MPSPDELQQAVAALVPAVEALRSQEATLQGRVQELQAQEQEAAVRLAAAQARLEERERQGEQLTAAEDRHLAVLRSAGDALRAVKDGLEADINKVREDRERETTRLRSDVAGLQTELTGIQAEVQRLQGDRASLEARLDVLHQAESAADERRQQAEQAAAAAEVRAQTAEAQAVAAGERLDTALGKLSALAEAISAKEQLGQELENRLSSLRAGITEANEMASELGQKVEGLRELYGQMRKQGRPLLPYVPPAERITEAEFPEQHNVKMEKQDRVAIKLYATESGLDMGVVNMEALRNYLPHEVYERALQQIEEELAERGKLAAGKRSERVSPSGAAADEVSKS